MNTFAAIAEPSRRRILDELGADERSVGDLVMTLGMGQPAVSKHLKVLREAGLVSCRIAGQRRMYRVEPARLQRIDEWLAPYRRLWVDHLDALEHHLDRQEER